MIPAIFAPLIAPVVFDQLNMIDNMNPKAKVAITIAHIM